MHTQYLTNLKNKIKKIAISAWTRIMIHSMRTHDNDELFFFNNFITFTTEETEHDK